MLAQLSASRGGLWMLTLSPVIWAAHLMAAYGLASIWCAKVAGPGGSLSTVRVVVAALTGLALVGIAIVARAGYREQRRGTLNAPHDRDTDEDRQRFLGLATLLLSGLSAVAVLFASLAALFIERC